MGGAGRVGLAVEGLFGGAMQCFCPESDLGYINTILALCVCSDGECDQMLAEILIYLVQIHM